MKNILQALSTLLGYIQDPTTFTWQGFLNALQNLFDSAVAVAGSPDAALALAEVHKFVDQIHVHKAAMVKQGALPDWVTAIWPILLQVLQEIIALLLAPKP